MRQMTADRYNLVTNPTFEEDLSEWLGIGDYLDFGVGTGNYIIHSGAPGIASAGTIEVYVYIDDMSTSTTLAEAIDTTSARFGISTTSTSIRAGFYNGSTYTNKVSHTVSGAGLYHIVASFSDPTSDTAVMSVNRVEATGNSQPILSNVARILAGRRDCNMKTVRVWSTALTLEEMQQLYDRTALPQVDSLVSEWLVNDESGATVLDSTGNGNDGTATGTYAWGGSAAANTQDDNEAYSGEKSLLVEPSTANVFTGGGKTTVSGLTIGVEYTFSAYVMQASDTDRICLLVPAREQGAVVASASWQRISATFTATATSHELHLFNVDGNNDFYIDAVMAEAASEAGEYFDGSVEGSGWQGDINASVSEHYPFVDAALKYIRQPFMQLYAAFERSFSPDADFFTIGTSSIAGEDVIKGNSSVLQEWDKFVYTEFSDRLMRAEYTHERDRFGSVLRGYADVMLKNHDDLFLPYGDSELAQYIRAGRPLRLYAGFQGEEALQVFIGQTTKVPRTDERSKTAQFHAQDFISSFYDQEVSQDRLYTSRDTAYILDDLLQNEAGLSPTQYTLDTALNTLDFAVVSKGEKLGEAISRLMQAEKGRFYMDEEGEIIFKNRLNATEITSTILHDGHTYDSGSPSVGRIVNRVKINSDVRRVSSQKQIHTLDGSLIEVLAGETVERFITFNDPITTWSHPSVGSGLEAFDQPDETGGSRNSDLTFTVDGEFYDAVKYVFENTSGTTLYITQLEIEGTPAEVIETIRIDESDEISIGQYEEQLLEIENDFFTDAAFALAIAQEVLSESASPDDVKILEIAGLPHMQVGDIVEHNEQTHVVDKITSSFDLVRGYTQTARVRGTRIASLFTIGESSIAGFDEIAI